MVSQEQSIRHWSDILNESLLLIQAYVSVIAVTALFLSVVVSERKRSEEALRAEKAFTDTIINSVPGRVLCA